MSYPNKLNKPTFVVGDYGHFSRGYGMPMFGQVERVEWSCDFGRTTYLVNFPNGDRTFTYPARRRRRLSPNEVLTSGAFNTCQFVGFGEDDRPMVRIFGRVQSVHYTAVETIRFADTRAVSGHKAASLSDFVKTV